MGCLRLQKLTGIVSVVDRWYEWWEKSGYFVADPHSKKSPFVIVSLTKLKAWSGFWPPWFWLGWSAFVIIHPRVKNHHWNTVMGLCEWTGGTSSQCNRSASYWSWSNRGSRGTGQRFCQGFCHGSAKDFVWQWWFHSWILYFVRSVDHVEKFMNRVCLSVYRTLLWDGGEWVVTTPSGCPVLIMRVLLPRWFLLFANGKSVRFILQMDLMMITNNREYFTCLWGDFYIGCGGEEDLQGEAANPTWCWSWEVCSWGKTLDLFCKMHAFL